ncbi:hypothetical protein F5B18DRAFT_598438 [Nemania serpens]|nr:hypothetical protein F5B18DRAFT_598438 [Nemania serpens]
MKPWISPIRSFHTFFNVLYLFASQSSSVSVIDSPIQRPRVVFIKPTSHLRSLDLESWMYSVTRPRQLLYDNQLSHTIAN